MGHQLERRDLDEAHAVDAVGAAVASLPRAGRSWFGGGAAILATLQGLRLLARGRVADADAARLDGAIARAHVVPRVIEHERAGGGSR